MNDQKYSQSALLEFFEYLKSKGLVKPNTVKNWKHTATQVFDILSEEETTDLRELDLEDAFTRFTNLKGKKYNSASLKTYKRRFENGVNTFIDWASDPLNFKPNIQSRKRKPVAQAKTSPLKGNVTPKSYSDALTFPIPIRPDCIVSIANIPSDLTANEAKKIAAVIVALAAPE